MTSLLASIDWDPFVRGLLIVIVAVLVLPGSVYLLLATNTGVRVGFLLAIAGLSGWFLIMGVVWAVFGIGVPGRTPGWKVQEIISGDVRNSTTLKDFPNAFDKLPPGNAELADAQSAADKLLASAAAAAGEGGGSTPKFHRPIPRLTTTSRLRASSRTTPPRGTSGITSSHRMVTTSTSTSSRCRQWCHSRRRVVRPRSRNLIPPSLW